MKGYKILDSNFQCQGMQYRVGRTNRYHDGLRPGEFGLHFCKIARDCLEYYPLDGHRFAEVEMEGGVDAGNQTVANVLTIVREMTELEFIQECVGPKAFIRDDNDHPEGCARGHGPCHHGIYRSIYADGRLRSEVVYEHGRLDGELREWYPNGRLAKRIGLVGTHIAPQFGGEFRTWWMNGNPAIRANYVLGIPHGKYQDFHLNGSTFHSIGMRNGKMHGKFTRWNSDGYRVLEQEYEHDRLIKDQRWPRKDIPGPDPITTIDFIKV